MRIERSIESFILPFFLGFSMSAISDGELERIIKHLCYGDKRSLQGEQCPYFPYCVPGIWIERSCRNYIFEYRQYEGPCCLIVSLVKEEGRVFRIVHFLQCDRTNFKDWCLTESHVTETYPDRQIKL